MIELSLRGVGKTYASAHGDPIALHPLDLDVERGEFITVLGPSGCGKTTLLRLLCGITAASSGEIHLSGRRIEALPPEQRDIAMVFQSYALFPHMTVGKNLAFGLKMKQVPAREQAERIAHAVDICNLGGLQGRMPRQLSGGQQQRVALARAIVMRPALLLFDEPLSNLDAQLRESLRLELRALHRRAGTTSLYVTHDQSEAMAMSDRVVLMNAGRVVEVGTPIALYRNPRHAFTAKFLGQTNLLRVPVEAGAAQLPWGSQVRVAAAEAVVRRGDCLVSLRPENIAIAARSDGVGEISAVSFAGAQVNYIVRAGGTELRVCAGGGAGGGAALLTPGQRVSLDVTAPLCALLDEPRSGAFP